MTEFIAAASLPILTCLRCGHSWVPRIARRPAQCPGCKQPRWDRPARADGSKKRTGVQSRMEAADMSQRNKFEPRKWTEARGYGRVDADGTLRRVTVPAHPPTAQEHEADRRKARRLAHQQYAGPKPAARPR